MNNKKLTLYTCAALVFGTLLVPQVGNSASGDQIAVAQRISTVQARQAESITQGMNLGKLTPREVKKLKKEQRVITLLKQTMANDGVITSDELSVLFAKLEIARKHINHLARNSITTSAKSVEAIRTAEQLH